MIGDHVQRFLAYAGGFRGGNPDDAANVEIKIRHCLAVLEEARGLVRDVRLAEEDRPPCLLAALYHDIGRFRQYARHKTFDDARSVNHGRLGARTLVGERLLRDLPQKDRRLILGVVGLHNAHLLSKRLPDRLARITRLVRDCDRLDIFSVLLAHFEPGAPYNPVVVMHTIPHPSAYSQAAVDSLKAKQPALYAHMVYVNDFKLALASWAYAMHYPSAIKKLKRSGMIGRLFDSLPKDPVLDALRRGVEADMDDMAASSSCTTAESPIR